MRRCGWGRMSGRSGKTRSPSGVSQIGEPSFTQAFREPVHQRSASWPAGRSPDSSRRGLSLSTSCASAVNPSALAFCTSSRLMAGSSSSMTLLQFRQTRNCPACTLSGVSQAMKALERVDTVDQPRVEQKIQRTVHGGRGLGLFALLERAENVVSPDGGMPLCDELQHAPAASGWSFAAAARNRPSRQPA